MSLALGSISATLADDKLGEEAIDTTINLLAGNTSPEAESEAAPVDDGSTGEEAAPTGGETPDDAQPAAEPAPPGDESIAAEPTEAAAAPTTESDAAATDSAAGPTSGTNEAATSADGTSESAAAAAPVDGGSQAVGASGEVSSDQQATSGGDETTIAPRQSSSHNRQSARGSAGRSTHETSLAQNAMRSVLGGGSPVLGAATVIGGGLPAAAGESGGAARGAGIRDSAESIAPASFGPVNHRGNDERVREPDNGTVVVNSLEDSGDQGKLAVHGHIVAGTLCDGSQFWSLDGGGTVNANGVTLSANGGIAASDASGGGDNIGAGGGSAGNGGSAHSSADGGIVVVDELVTGNNRGNQVAVGDQTFNGDCGHGVIDGGDVTTTSNINISADGGVALADASGGDGNIAVGDGANAGNGGRARASADGGIVLVGSIITGGNEGNTIGVGTGTGAGSESGSGGSGSGAANGCLGAGSSINGGSMSNENNIDISADGGRALADAAGGDDNLALGDGANVGNGGIARANADGGLIMVDSIITGYNQGNTIGVACGGAGGGGGAGSGATTTINGGTITNVTNLSINADGGTAIADASAGDDNVAVGGRSNGNGISSAGNGGRAVSTANGGVIDVGNIITGRNVGNVISVGGTASPSTPNNPPKTPRTIKQKGGTPTRSAGGQTAGKASVMSVKAGKQGNAGRARAGQSVGKLPDTGTGPVASQLTSSWLVLLSVLSAIAAGLVAGVPGRPQQTRSHRRRVRRG